MYTSSANPHPRQKLDVYTPSSLENPAPIIMFVHGGCWKRGDRGIGCFNCLYNAIILLKIACRRSSYLWSLSCWTVACKKRY